MGTCLYQLSFRWCMLYEVGMPYLVTYLYRTPILEWYVISCGSKNGHQKDMCLKYIQLHAQNVIYIPNAIVNIVGGLV